MMTEKKTKKKLKDQDQSKTTEELTSKQKKQARLETQNMVNQIKQKLVPEKSTKKTWLIQPQPIWYDTNLLPDLPKSSKPSSHQISEESIQLLKTRADFILKTISDRFAISIQPGKLSNSTSKSTPTGLSESDKAFIHRILTSGTSSDKLSALTLLVSSAPLYSRNHLSALLNLSKKKNREEAGRTIRAVVEWLRGGGNPQIGGLPARKLKYFRDQPALVLVAQSHKLTRPRSSFKYDDETPQENDEWLALWAFEDWLKNWYLDFLRVIETLSHDPLAFVRSQSLSHLFNLLKDKPEQEQNLLTLLVNKLGDGDKMICSRTSHYILQLLQVHPLMKAIISREISALVLKPINRFNKAQHQTRASDDPSLRHHDHARYYGTITLNQTPLSKADAEVANKLIQLYFELFNDILGKTQAEDDIESQEMKEKNEDDIETENLEEQELAKRKSKGKKGSKNSSSHKPSQAMSEEEAVGEKKARLVAAILTGLNRAFPYGSIENETLKGYMDTLFRVIHTGSFNVSIQALILVQHVLKSKPDLSDRFYRVLYGTLIDHRLLTATSKHSLYLNLLFKSINADLKISRVLAFVKRIIQVLPYHQPPFICSTIVLLGHLFAAKKNCNQLLVNLPATSESTEDSEKPPAEIQYDGRKRDPTYANAEKSCIWELVPLLSHYHPAVSLNAKQLLSGEPISSSVDLNHHTLSQFLDKFAYRQPKKNVTQKGSSIMQPDLHYRLGDVVKRRANDKAAASDQTLVNSKSFLNRNEDEIPVDEVFFHKFFKKKELNEKKNKRLKDQNSKNTLTEDNDFGGRGGSDDGSEEDDEEGDEKGMEEEGEEDEDEVWQAMKSTMGKELKDAMPDDEDEWSEMDAKVFEDDSEEDDSDVGELLKEEEGSSDDDEEEQSEFENEEISVSGLEEESTSASDRETQPSNRKRKASASQHRQQSLDDKQSKPKKRKAWKSMPTFASADDYLHLLANDEES